MISADLIIPTEPAVRSSSMARATIKIIIDFYSETSSTLSIARASINNANHIRQSGFINEIVSKTNSQIVNVIEEHYYLNQNLLRFFNILFVDSYEAFRLVKLYKGLLKPFIL